MEQLFTVNALYFYLIAVAGVAAHIFKKWYSGELIVSVYDYLFKSNVKSTVGMVVTTLGGVASGILSGTFTDPQVGAQVLAVFFGGYAANSAINKQE